MDVRTILHEAAPSVEHLLAKARQSKRNLDLFVVYQVVVGRENRQAGVSGLVVGDVDVVLSVLVFYRLLLAHNQILYFAILPEEIKGF